MMKEKLWAPVLFISIMGFSQVGINTENPGATLDVVAKTNDGSKAEGMIIPRLTGNEIKNADSKYGAAQKGTLIYATQAVSPSSTKTQNITAEGYYYFDGILWKPLPRPSLNGLYKEEITAKLGGAIIEPTTITGLSNINKFTITGTGQDMMNIGANTFSVDGTQKRIGIGTVSPAQTLDIEGTARLSQTNAANTPLQLGFGATQYVPLYATNTGQIVYTPPGFLRLGGGYRPSNTPAFLVATLPVNNTIARIRFMCYIKNNGPENSYTYGEFTIIGTGPDNPIKFVQKDIRNANGAPKNLVNDNDTEISWDEGGTLGVAQIVINQTNGVVELRAVTDNLACFFEVLGGT